MPGGPASNLSRLEHRPPLSKGRSSLGTQGSGISGHSTQYLFSSPLCRPFRQDRPALVCTEGRREARWKRGLRERGKERERREERKRRRVRGGREGEGKG